ncbi:uncharacterized protein LOC110112658 isoform X1 [Dendrobium catenatum]|uniref:uncharacterized protein LOC110112658 isoform X1 n=2 Tax=Dendrobium catenatum TaxID=906689 RepID=UPI0009F62384|nr:uncharacterized protein LOC110112658 isoform X1 [Dendrobium catenatum]
MDRRFSRSVRTKSGEMASYHAGVRVRRQAAASALDFSTEAYYLPRKQTKYPKVDLRSTSSEDSTTEEDLFSHGLHGRLCKKVGGTAVNKITDEVVSRIVEKRRSSPSVIARLMGLDELPPPQVVPELKNENGHFLLKKSFARLGDKYEYSGSQSFHVSRRQHQNFKIVHDHFDSSNSHIDQVAQKEKRNSKPDIAFIKRQFIEAKSLSTKEAHKRSKELSDALDIMFANKDIFLKIFQDPNSLFAKHFHNLKHSKSSANTNHFKILESSAGKSETFYRLVEETRESTRKKKDTTHCCKKPCTSLYSHSTFDHVDSHLPMLIRSRYTGKTENSPHPILTSIVVLKPSDQKAPSTGITESFPGYLQNYKLSSSRHKDFHRELLVERGQQHQFFDVKTKGCNTKAANDVASDISNEVKQSLRSYSDEELAKTDKFNSSSTYLSVPSRSREAVKSLSEQWKTTRPSRQRLFGEGSSTLGEMLFFSGKETPRTLGQLILKKNSHKKLDKKDIHSSCSYRSGISSNDGWKDECDEWLPRFEDHPDSSAIYGSSKTENRWQVDCINAIEDCCMLKDVLNLERNDLHNSIIERGHSLLRNLKYDDNKPQFLRSCGEENRRPTREVEGCQDESRNMINLNNLVEPKPIYLQRKMDDLLHLVCNSPNPKKLDSDKSFLTNPKEFQQSAKFNDLSVTILKNEVQEVASVDFLLVESPLDVIRVSGPHILPKVAERLSPVSVLETPSEDGKSTPQCLERFSADLQDIQRKLNFLELETVHSGDEHSKPLIFDDEVNKKILNSLKNESERDFLYLLDILTVSGIYAASQNKFFDACYSPDYPVFPDVFDKLESEYHMVNSWPRSDRKLLFDHINSILAEVLAPCMDFHPWVKLKRRNSCGHGRLVDESWRLLVRQQKELSRGKPDEKVLDTRWFYIDDHMDMIGREIERMLKDDLLNELVFEFVLGYPNSIHGF